MTPKAFALPVFIAVGMMLLAGCDSTPPTQIVDGHRVAVIEMNHCDDGGSCGIGFTMAGVSYSLSTCLRTDFSQGDLYAVPADAQSTVTEVRKIRGVASRTVLAARLRWRPDCTWLLAEERFIDPTDKAALSDGTKARLCANLATPNAAYCGTDPESGPAPAPDDAALWAVDAATPLTATATSFTALVRRLGCNNGVTGRVQPPEISFEAKRVVVTFAVENSPNPDPGAISTCQGNDAVPYRVELGEQLGTRDLVDGACKALHEGTSFCVNDEGVRWHHQ